MKAKQALDKAMEDYKKRAKEKLSEILKPWERINKLIKDKKLCWQQYTDRTRIRDGFYLIETWVGYVEIVQRGYNFPGLCWWDNGNVIRFVYLGDYGAKKNTSALDSTAH